MSVKGTKETKERRVNGQFSSNVELKDGLPDRSKGELTLEYMKTILNKYHKKNVTQSTVDELNRLIADTQYGEEFKDTFISHSHVLGESNRGYTLPKYVSAVKYYSLMSTGMSQIDAYVRVFPDRVQAALDNGRTRDSLSGDASRYNSGSLVNKIREQAMVPLHLVNQHNVQKLINEGMYLALNAKSEMVRGTMIAQLIKELRPSDTQHIELAVGLTTEAQAAQAAQNDTLAQIAEQQQKLLAAGHSIEDVQKIHITKKEYTDVEIEDE